MQPIKITFISEENTRLSSVKSFYIPKKDEQINFDKTSYTVTGITWNYFTVTPEPEITIYLKRI